MKKLFAVFVVMLLILPSLFARSGPRKRWFRYDKKNEKMYPGVIISAGIRKGKRHSRFRVKFKSGSVTYSLSAGPKGWLAGKGISLAAGKRVIVRGIVFKRRRRPFLMARTISCGGRTVVLREDNGRAKWPRRKRVR